MILQNANEIGERVPPPSPLPGTLHPLQHISLSNDIGFLEHCNVLCAFCAWKKKMSTVFLIVVLLTNLSLQGGEDIIP